MIFFFGVKSAGAVDYVGNTAIVTRFLVIGLPLVPLGSYCALVSDKHFRLTKPAVALVSAGWDIKSIIAGYARFYCWLPTLAFWLMDPIRTFHISFITSGYIGLGLFVIFFAATMLLFRRASPAARHERLDFLAQAGIPVHDSIASTERFDQTQGNPVILTRDGR
jgi:hypothetical protein